TAVPVPVDDATGVNRHLEWNPGKFRPAAWVSIVLRTGEECQGIGCVSGRIGFHEFGHGELGHLLSIHAHANAPKVSAGPTIIGSAEGGITIAPSVEANANTR